MNTHASIKTNLGEPSVAARNQPAEQQAAARLLAVFTLVHVLVWTAVPYLARANGALWDDMLENYAWAQEWQLGYYKHPPFYAWVVGAWFQLFPRTEWAYYLLSAVNVGIGFAGVWTLAGRFLKPQARLLCVLLLTFMPYYNYMASNFNANTILLSIWPWTAYAFVRSLETRSLAWSAAFGALGALGLLSKYYSVLLLVSCAASSLAHPSVRRYYTSPAPYVAIASAIVICAPHIWWSVQNDFPPVRYALGKTVLSWSIDFYKAVTTAFASLAINAIAAIILIGVLRWRRSVLLSRIWRKLISRENAWLLILACGPFALTILLGAIGYIKIAVNFMIPVFFMLPMIIMLALEPAITRRTVHDMVKAAAVVLVLALAVAPAAAYVTFKYQVKGTTNVSPIAAADAAARWHAAFAVPVRIVSGSELYSLAQVFYTSEHPSEFTHFSFSHAPWITPARIGREGLLSICTATDADCLAHTQAYQTPQTVIHKARIQTTAYGITGPAQDLVYVMTPPTPPKF